MMYEMLSGQLPFDAEDAVEVAIKQISDQPKSLHEIAPQCLPHWWRSPKSHGEAAAEPVCFGP